MTEETSLSSQLFNKSKNLRKCATRVTRQDGYSYIETPSSDENNASLSAQFNNQCPGFVIDNKPDISCSFIKPHLALSSQDVPNDDDLLNANGISHILSLLPPFNDCEQLLTVDDNGLPCPFSLRNVLEDSVYIDKHTESTGKSKIKESCEAFPADAKTRERVYVPILDNPEFNISQDFSRCSAYIDNVKRSGGVVLVHCNAGVSRAATVVCAHLIKSEGLTFAQAFDVVKAARPHVRPNDGFVEQLKIYESELKPVGL